MTYKRFSPNKILENRLILYYGAADLLTFIIEAWQAT